MKFYYEQRSKSFVFNKLDHLTFDPHVHVQAEFIFMQKGLSSCFIDGSEYLLSEGDAAIVFSNQIHSYKELGGVFCSHIIIDPTDFPELKHILSNKVPVCPIVKKQLLEKNDFYSVYNLSFNEFKTGNDIIKKGALLMVLGKLLSLCDFTAKENRGEYLINDLLDFCQNNYREKISLPQTAKALHISTSYLSHIFSDKFLISFTDYINSLRINDACALLKSSDISITEISDMCGFSTIRTFNRAFSKITGTTPRNYRNS